MSIKIAIYARLAAFSGLTSLVGDRIWRGHLPQKGEYPSVTYRKVTGERVESCDGHSGLAHPVFEITAWSDSETEAEAVAEQVRLALEGYAGDVAIDDESPQGTVTIRAIAHLDQSDVIYEDNLEVFGNAHEFEVWHLEDKPVF